MISEKDQNDLKEYCDKLYIEKEFPLFDTEGLHKIIIVGSDPINGLDIIRELFCPDLSGTMDKETIQCFLESYPQLEFPEIEKEENKKPRKRWKGKPKWPRK